MAEQIKDAEDRILESMFESEPLADNGFSQQVTSRLRRRLWVQRLALPVAAVIGGLIAFKPLAGLVAGIANVRSLIPDELVNSTASALPSAPTIVLGAMLLGVVLLAGRALEE